MAVQKVRVHCEQGYEFFMALFEKNVMGVH